MVTLESHHFNKFYSAPELFNHQPTLQKGTTEIMYMLSDLQLQHKIDQGIVHKLVKGIPQSLNLEAIKKRLCSIFSTQ